VLECMGPIASKVTARPFSLNSAAHKNLTLAVRQRTMKKAKIAEFHAMVDPEKEKNERIKNKEDLNKEASRGSGARRTVRKRGPGMNRYYIESKEDAANYDTVNINALKRRNEDMSFDTMAYRAESGSEEDEWSRKKRSALKKRKAAGIDRDDDPEDEEDIFQEESDDEEEKIMTSGKSRNRQVVDDDE